MRTLYVLAALLLFAPAPPAIAQKLSKEEKARQAEEAFKSIRTLIESRAFQIEINRVFPASGKDVSRFNPRGKISINDTLAKGHLPFFGRAYSLPYGESGGIEFDGKIRDEKIKTIEKKKKRSIVYTFSVTGKNDHYQFTIEAAGGNNCTVSLNSNNRAHISYSGTVSPLEKDAKTEKQEH